MVLHDNAGATEWTAVALQPLSETSLKSSGEGKSPGSRALSSVPVFTEHWRNEQMCAFIAIKDQCVLLYQLKPAV